MIEVKKATIDDVFIILSYIKKLAEYEKMLNEVKANEKLLKKWIFEEKKADVLLAYYDGLPVGFALYFYNFSTFLGKCGIYLEDLFVDLNYRNKGVGKALLKELTKIAVENDFERIDWVCLKDNQPSLEIYRRIGAKTKDEWLLHRLEKNEIINFNKANK